MSHLSRHESYHNRFRTSTSGGDDDNARTDGPPHNLPSVSEAVDIFGQSPDFGRLSFAMPVDGEVHHQNSHGPWSFERSHSLVDSQILGTDKGQRYSLDHTSTAGEQAPDAEHSPTSGQQPSRPTAPGKPRRLSRQTSADGRRQQFASSKPASGEARHLNTLSVDSGCDDVFVDMNGFPVHDPTLFPVSAFQRNSF